MNAWLTTSYRPVPRATTTNCPRRTGPDRRTGQPRSTGARTTTTTTGGIGRTASVSTRRRRCRTHPGRTSAARCPSSRTSRSRRTCRDHRRHRLSNNSGSGTAISLRRSARIPSRTGRTASSRSGRSTTVNSRAASSQAESRLAASSPVVSSCGSSRRRRVRLSSRGGLVRSARVVTAYRRTGRPDHGSSRHHVRPLPHRAATGTPRGRTTRTGRATGALPQRKVLHRRTTTG